MLVKISEDENHNKIAKPIAGATLGQGVPLGAWCSFEKDVAPSSNWLMAGTTFDATKYPALNLYLGTNKVPSRYDHSRLTDPETITLSTDSNNPTVMPYDGFLNVWTTNSSSLVITINGVSMPLFAYATTVSSEVGNPTMFAFNKGDTISYTGAGTFYVRYYTHPLFIKATSIASDSDQQAILAQIRTLVANNDLLSDFETIANADLNGNTWATAYECPYDGFIYGANNNKTINGILWCAEDNSISLADYTGNNVTEHIPVKKGWRIYIRNSDNPTIKASWYKLRDYSSR